MNCSLCQSTRCSLFFTLGSRGKYKFYRCNECGLVIYDRTGGLDQKKYAVRIRDPEDPAHASNKIQSQSYDFIQRHIHSRGRFLDIGCGNGHLLSRARDDGWTVEGLELSSELAEYVKNRLDIDVITADFMHFVPRDRNQYDCIVLRHVLEHLPDPVAAMNSIHSLLAPGGMALLEFPNIMGLDCRVKRVVRKTGLYTKKYREDYRPGHCHEFCRKSFSRLIDMTGFKLQVWETYSIRPLANLLYRTIHIGNKARALIQKT
ncbi:MAG: methyltransferase domain-containing protein [Chitinivibrionales bacterium]|nr:methyltransferase domain-containing protein [Chitinivibrionales bacterium]